MVPKFLSKQPLVSPSMYQQYVPYYTPAVTTITRQLAVVSQLELPLQSVVKVSAI